MNQRSGVYKISFCGTDKFYIGSAVDLTKRKLNHISDLLNNRHANIHMQRLFNKYGKESFNFEIVEYVPPESLIKVEQKYITELEPQINILKTAYSSLGYKHKKEALEKIKTKALELSEDPVWIDSVSKGWFKKGSKRSIESRRKQSESLKIKNHMTGKKHSEETKAKMRARALERNRK